MDKKHIIFAAVVIFMSCLPLSCAGQDLVSDIISNNEIRVGIVLDCPPFAFLDENGNVAGFDADIAAEIAARLNVRLRVIELRFEDITSNPECDILVASVPRSIDLASLYKFSEPYFQSGQSLILAENSVSAKSAGELDEPGKRIAAVEGTPGMQAASKVFKKASIGTAKNDAEALAMLLRKNADAFVCDRRIAEYICLSHPEWKVLPGQISSDYYCVLFPRGSGDTKKVEEWFCLTWFNVFLTELKSSKRYVEIFDRWFGPGKALRR